MRIAHVITRLILGGAQENTVLCCEDLMREYGDEVLLVTGPPLGPEGSLLERAERARAGGVLLKIIPQLRRPINPWRDLASYWRIKDALRRFRPEVVHTHSAKGGFLGRAAAWSLGVPAVVHTVHGAPFHPYQGRGARLLFQTCERWAARRCHALVSVADAMTELMVAAGVAPREKFTTIYSGMEVEPFLRCGQHRERVRRELGYGSQHVVIGKIARLFRLKGHADVIEAARNVVAAQPNVRFLFVGDGVLRGQLEWQIAAAGLAGHFQFTGLVPPERIPELLSATDIVVHASLREGLARVLPQALIAGKPVVSYDVDGAREVVIPEQTGLLVPPGAFPLSLWERARVRADSLCERVRETRPQGDSPIFADHRCATVPAKIGTVPGERAGGRSACSGVSGLAAALNRLVADPALRDRLGQEGRRRFADLFRHERMTAQLRALYAALLL